MPGSYLAPKPLNCVSRRALIAAAATGIVLTACGNETAPAPQPAASLEPEPTSPAPVPQSSSEAVSRPDMTLIPLQEDEQEAVAKWKNRGWQTDFSIKSVHLSEITQAAAFRDVIPPIDDPQFLQASELSDAIPGNEPIAVLQQGEIVKAYPLRILTWHEIVNDSVGGAPVAATYCPLCNTATGFKRVIDGTVLRLGVSANLRASNLIMWDDQSESWWQQGTGEAIVGAHTGRRLDFVPMAVASFSTLLESWPDSRVLTEDTGQSRSYGDNPYVGYDSGSRKPFLFYGDVDDRLNAYERVAIVAIGGQQVAYPFSELAKQRIVTDIVSGEPIVLFFQPGTASALDKRSIADSRDVGAAGVFVPSLDGKPIAFELADGQIIDSNTGSIWNSLGVAVSGELAGRQLEPVVHGNDLWFALAALRQEVRLYRA